jgi:cobalt transporter subunit CbtA
MNLFRRIVFVAAIVGFVSGLAMTGLQYAGTVPLILQAETYEHAATDTPPAAHDHAAAMAWSPADGLERFVFTAIANVLSAVGFALLLVAAGELRGGIATWREGLLWGLAGFAAFTLAPSISLPPALPGAPEVPLEARQLWWVTTVVLTASALALVAMRRTWPFIAFAVALALLPHLIGAPQPEGDAESLVPASLAREFVVAVVVTSFAFWLLLGGLAGYVRARVVAR